MRKIAIANYKGGVGKSTTTINLGAALALLGNKVLVIDADQKGHTTLGLGIRTDKHLTLAEYLISDDVSLADVIQKTSMNGLFLIPCDLSLAVAGVKMAKKKECEFVLAKKLKLLTGYDFVIFDCSSIIGPIAMNVFMASDEIILPINLGFFALKSINALNETIRLINHDFKHKIDISRVLVTFFEDHTNLSRDVYARIKEIFKDKIFKTTIPNNIKLNESQEHGKTIFEYAPRSSGAQGYLEVAREIMKG